MDLRPELRLPEIAPERLDALGAAIERIGELIETGQRAEADAAIAAFNADTGGDYDPYFFACYWESMSLEEAAFGAALPVWPKVDGITRDELIELVRRVQVGEENAGWFDHVLEANVPYFRVHDVHRHPEGMTPAGIVDAALAWRPMAL
ncbi:hypothetical protein [Actinoplanes sp. L3-i22]|uniref:hypothetical protein n=1 Tax=Actinoplanes sp. L3-i22 TaxID=2836373 RepID=UPI001C748864|nr:hypothetical protein [Actinoplanes sp. L3-i22]BCY11210.1 hypothetical protein L3i22_062980 [Actinoplanes sp. L3-i22]